MGLLDWIRTLTAGMRGVRAPTAPALPPLVVPSMGNERSVYCYDGNPLAGMLVGDCLDLTVIPGEVTMTSVYTGTERTGTGCLAYQGRPVGYIGHTTYYAELLDELARTHAVTVHARIDGIDPRGWPLLTVDMADHEWFARATGRAGRRVDGCA